MAEEATSQRITIKIPGIKDIIGSIWAKILAILAAISILLGIFIEFQSFITGYYVLQKTISDARTAAFQPEIAAFQLERAKYETMAAAYLPRKSEGDADIAQQNAHYAKSIGKYP